MEQLQNPRAAITAVRRLVQFFDDAMAKDNRNLHGPNVKPLLDKIVEPLERSWPMVKAVYLTLLPAALKMGLTTETQSVAFLAEMGSVDCVLRQHLTFRASWVRYTIMKHSVPHDLGKDKALKVTQAAWQSYSERFAKYHPTCTWSSPFRADIGFTAKGIKLTGDIEVCDTNIEIDLDVPFLMRPFKNMAIEVVEKEIQTWIAKSKAGEI